MIRSILAFYCAGIFLFFYTCCTKLDDELATGTIEAIVDSLRANRNLYAIQSHYRKALEDAR